MNRLTVFVAAGVAGVAFAKGAALAPSLAASLYKYGYELAFEGDGDYTYNAPKVTLTNTGNTRITGLSLTIGDASRNFDAFVGPTITGDLSYNLLTVDDDNHGLRSDTFDVSFAGFDLAEVWGGLLDVDKDVFGPKSPGTVEDIRNVLWGSGLGNAQLVITFEDGFTLTGTLPTDFNQQALAATLAASNVVSRTNHSQTGDKWVFGQDLQEVPVPTVPTPAAAMTGLALLAGTLLRRR